MRSARVIVACCTLLGCGSTARSAGPAGLPTAGGADAGGAAGAGAGPDLERRLGIVARRDGPACLRIRNDGLRPGDTVGVVVGEAGGQRLVRTVVVARQARCPDAPPEQGVASYRLSAAEDLDAVAIAIVPPPAAARPGGAGLRADLDGDGRSESFRSCTSSEGVHLSVWTGAPLRGARRWHAYYYLGYDVEPSCEEGDYS